MCDFSLCIGCPYDDPDFGCLRSPGDDCRLVEHEAQAEDRSSVAAVRDVFQKEVSS